MMNTILRYTIICIIIGSIITYFFYKDKVTYTYVGKFEYEIINKELFQRTYLYDSFGYVIGDVEIPGMKIIGVDSLLHQDIDYVLSINYPIVNIITKTCDCDYEPKVPIKATLNHKIKTNHVYIYKLNSQGKYGLMIP